MNDLANIVLQKHACYDEWREQCRNLLQRSVPPERVSFNPPNANHDLFGRSTISPEPESRDRVQTAQLNDTHRHSSSLRVPREFPNLARQVLCHSNDSRFSLMYRLLWRVQTDRRLLHNESDRDVWKAQKLAQSVRRDSHKMKAFVRFRQIHDEHGEAFVAWFEPEHHIVERTAPFFAKRFAGMRWSIVTPQASAHWDGTRLTFDDGAQRADCPDNDALEHHWRIYYSSIFNPARLKVKAMMAEMPAKYWRNLPESQLIPELIRSATNAQRAAPAGTAPSIRKARQLVAAQPHMTDGPQSSPRTPKDIAHALQSCNRCTLCHQGTAAVPGEGPDTASLMIVGEQPGDQEDLTGRPFIGPAGDVLNEGLNAANIERTAAYITNAVKHFKHRVRGKRRLHQRPDLNNIDQCRWWLDLERQVIAPRVILALGATAARALTGENITVSHVRGTPIRLDESALLVVTIHPAYLLRIRDPQKKRHQHAQFISDLTLARSLLATPQRA